jgi:chromosome segregation protein
LDKHKIGLQAGEQTLVHIKRLILENFKSYGRRKVTLNLTKGLTVVSGPNGCGKSNISDAIQFVIGQLSSKTIRSEKIAGVIFSGTKEGQKTAPFAKVTLILDNSSEPKEIPISTDEVHIGRKVFLDGRSEYYLNGSKITRNEIIDTLGICGITIDGYNVIRQGEIANFSNMSPLEIRGLFEEIAGIAAYDEKKDKAEKNLEKARTKLRIATVRVEESIKNLNRLEKEKEDALRYQELKVKIKNTEAKLIHGRIRHFKDQIKELEQKISDFEGKKEDIKTRIKEMGVAIKNYDNMILEAKKKVKDATTQSINELSKEIEQLTKQESEKITKKNQIVSQLTELENQEEELQEELDKLQEERKELEEHTESAIEQLEGTDITLKKIQQELETKRQLLESSKNTELMERLEAIRSEYAEMNKRKANVESQLVIITNNLKITESKIEEREKRVVDVAGILANFLSRKAKYVSEIAQYNEEIRKLEIKVEESRSEFATVEKEIEETEENIRETALTIKRIQTEMATTNRIMQQIKEGDKGIQQVLQARDKGIIKGIYGTVGELCKTHPKYSIALNVTAGARSNHVVVQDDEVAAQCVMMIKKSKAGRVTFLPLNKIRPMVISQDITGKGIIGRALDLVKFDEKYRKAAEYVFGQTLIVKNLDAARRFGFTNRAVTLDGDIVNPSGTITGGFYRGSSRSNISLIVEDEKELPLLEDELQILQDERDRLLEYRSFVSKELNDEFIPQLNETKRNRDLRERDLKITEEEIELRGQENMKIQQELESLTEEQEELEQQINELEEKRKDIELSLDTLHDAERRTKEELDNSGVQDILDEIKMKEEQQGQIGDIINELKMKQFQSKSDLKATKKEIEKLEKKLEAINNKKPTVQEKLADINKEINELTLSLEQRQEERDTLYKVIEESQNEQERLEIEQRRLREQLEEKREEQNQTIILIERFNNEKANAKGQIKDLERIAIERDLPYVFAEDERIDIEVLSEVMNGLKAELESLPEINMKAITQYEEELELNKELVEKRKFVEKDYDAISQAISDIENEKRSKFMTVFNNISKDFNRIFGILSPDGRAKLELEDPDDPFNGGIIIMANPGGKKISSMLSLSGGEKSLTALAMIFAIQRYKPAPFYVFDEIDAFLDVNNVHKVAKLVREMSTDTQILVISLRAPMIATAEKIFGVTAGEDRISQIVTVSLDEIMKIVDQTKLPAQAEVYDY